MPSRARVSCLFPARGVNVQRLHVALADVLEAQLRAANGPLARGELAVEDVLWDTTILHPVVVAKPAQPALSEQREHGREVRLGQHLSVGHFVSPRDVENPAEATQMEAVQPSLLFGVGCPGLCTQQSWF